MTSTLNLFRFCLMTLLLSQAALSLAGTPDGASSKAEAKTEQAQAAKVNINTASAQELEALPRIGPATAQRIIAFREAHEGFKRAEELMNVKGIGTKTFERLEPLITL